jgi:hypothetical protein
VNWIALTNFITALPLTNSPPSINRRFYRATVNLRYCDAISFSAVIGVGISGSIE